MKHGDTVVKYYAGELGLGPCIAKIEFEFRHLDGERGLGLFKIRRVLREYYGTTSVFTPGTHITAGDFYSKSYDTLAEACEHMKIQYHDRIAAHEREAEALKQSISEIEKVTDDE